MIQQRLIMACVALLTTQSLLAEETLRFEVHAGTFARGASPITVVLPESVGAEEQLTLVNEETGNSVPIQRVLRDQRAIFILDAPLAAHASRTYRLTLQSESSPTDQSSADSQPARAVVMDDAVSLQLQDHLILNYNTSVVDPPTGTSPLYRRSGHIHPFLTPKGRIVTDDFPSDHLHQHAIFAAWTKTEFEGKRVDFWNQAAGTGTVSHDKVFASQSGPVFAELKTQLLHVVDPEQPREVLDENWTVRLYNIPDQSLFDLESVQVCVAETPLTLAEYHYGGFAFRGASEWIDNDQHQIVTNLTDDRQAANHSRPDWVAIFGPMKGSWCGAAMFSAPNNFRSPQPVRVHPKMPYFVYSPCVLGEFDLIPGEPYHSRYRYLAFDGRPKGTELSQAWTEYANPPRITWVAPMTEDAEQD